MKNKNNSMCIEKVKLNLPEFVKSIFYVQGMCTVDINQLFVCMWLPVGCKKAYVPVERTPHYMFAREVLTGESGWPISGYQSYAHYISKRPHLCTEDKFIDLIDSFRINGYDYKNRPILVFRSWRRPWPIRRWDVEDGFHRLSVLAAMGERSVTVITLKRKKNFFQRIVNRFYRR